MTLARKDGMGSLDFYRRVVRAPSHLAAERKVRRYLINTYYNSANSKYGVEFTFEVGKEPTKAIKHYRWNRGLLVNEA
jgi:hypothetical protein